MCGQEKLIHTALEPVRLQMPFGLCGTPREVWALLPHLHSSWHVQRRRQCVQLSLMNDATYSIFHLAATGEVAEIARGSELTIEY